jgi:GNAT superfamily N-acetyltransferase
MTNSEGTSFQKIRKLKPNEPDEFIRLMELVFEDSIDENRTNPDELRKTMKKLLTPGYRFLTRAMGMKLEFYVAEIEDTVASGILFQIEKDQIYVSDLMTHLEYRRRGLARSLLQLSFKRAHELGVKKVRIDVRAHNTNALDLFSSEGFEPTYHSGRFELDSAIESTSNDLIIREITKIDLKHIDAMLDDCYPESYMESFGREKLLKDLITSRAMRFLVRRLGGQSIRSYAIYTDGEEKPRGFIEASQSRVERRIILSSPILFEEDNELLMEFIPRILEIETGYSGVTTATVNLSMHRTEVISNFERLGFKKVRENISMTKRL